MNPQNLLDLMTKRRSVRKYADTTVEKEKLLDLLEAARWAPSAGNKQPLEIIVVDDNDTKNLLVEAALGQKFIADAPYVLVICANVERTSSRYGERGSSLYCLQDTAASIQNILLLTTAHGLSSCWIGAFDEQKVKDVCSIPDFVRPIALIPVAYPASLEEKRAPPRRELKEITFGNAYGKVFMEP
ncbi:MAG: nitroreductase family protein [Candidatus Heimdallarchaeota archaeon]|nr:nitroreductase family protein [Candidatus Heimdallarchaeota archaeon]MCK5048108.1 nitroreductase family protein [Candidatus Heimdallarchaeota archaeon]